MDILDILMYTSSIKKKSNKKREYFLTGGKKFIINYKSLIYYNLFRLFTSQVCDPKDAYC